MLALLQPVKNEGLKELCAGRLEALILSGQMPVGHRLPPERELARQLGVSRPVIHEALVDLAGKGLVTLVPRIGAVVNDFRKQGSVALLTSLLKYQQGELAPKLLEGLLAMRILFEVETARLAAIHRCDTHNQALREVILAEERTEPTDIGRLTALDFDFHHLVAMASGNQTYPLLLNSFKPVYTNLSGQFFKDPTVVPTVIGFHRDLADAIKKQDDQMAIAAMRCLLNHGEDHLRGDIAV
ncbi:MAG: FadR family transcriptional regulator [Desulfatitalea sp.]|nr:FadR family transcriptional regulator [Desulfatitalea sp.]